jgi:hypothetical protein
MGGDARKKKDTKDLIDRLRYYNDWRRGADTEMPEPKQIGQDIDDAISLLEKTIQNHEARP